MNRYNEHDGLVIFLDALGVKDIQDKEHAFRLLTNWDKVYEVFRTANK